MISICYMTFDRYPESIERLKINLRKTGLYRDEYELLWCDQGSINQANFAKDMEQFAPDYIRLNKGNMGIARTMNQLFLRSKGRYIVQLGNDYTLPQDWLKSMIKHADTIENTGMVGIPWAEGHRGPIKILNGIRVNIGAQDNPIFGSKLKTRTMLEKVGAFDEMLHPYGLEDSDYHIRSVLAGFHNYHIKDLKSEHLGRQDVPVYRQMKDHSLKANHYHFINKDYARFGYYIPFPPMK